MEGARRELGPIVSYSPNAKACVKGSDLVIIMTAWREFQDLDSDELTTLMGGRARVLDARRIFDPARFSKAEFTATGLGRLSN